MTGAASPVAVSSRAIPRRAALGGRAHDADRTAASAIASVGVAFPLLLALLSTAMAYRFGVGNQEEHLPIILRQMDAGYLSGDFFVSSSVEFGPRYYFARLLALSATLVSLPWAYAIWRFASDLALVVVTMWAAVRIMGADRLGAMIAAVLTLTVSSIHLGDATELRYDVFQPASLAIPGMLFAIGLGLRGRPVAAALVASLACVPHPLYGVYAGAIGLAAGGLALLMPAGGIPAAGPWQARALEWRRAIPWTAAGAAIFGTTVLVLWWWPAQGVYGTQASTGELFDILVRFRSPHHYLPSHFRPQDYVTTALFVWAGGLAFGRWRRAAPARTALLLLVPVALVGLGCLVGALFTEWWPVRAVLTAQPFRLLAVLKWIGFLLFGWLLAEYLRRPPDAMSRPVAALSLLAAGGAHALVTAAGLSLVRFRDWLPRRVSPYVWVGLLAAGLMALSVSFGTVEERVRLFAAVGMVAAFSQRRPAWRLAAVVAVVASVAAAAANRPGRGASFTVPALQSIFTTDDLVDPRADAARAAARVTPVDAVFVAPPDFGILRIVGQRALVVDFEAVPFQDVHMREWRDRIRQVYGDTGSTGHAARKALDEAFRAVDDAHLEALTARYGATHAVLYVETPSSLSELYANGTYRIVQVGR